MQNSIPNLQALAQPFHGKHDRLVLYYISNAHRNNHDGAPSLRNVKTRLIHGIRTQLAFSQGETNNLNVVLRAGRTSPSGKVDALILLVAANIDEQKLYYVRIGAIRREEIIEIRFFATFPNGYHRNARLEDRFRR